MKRPKGPPNITIRERVAWNDPIPWLVGLLFWAVFIAVAVITSNSHAGGRSCCSDRDILAAGARAAHSTLTQTALEWDGNGYATSQKNVRKAIKQLEDSTRAAGIDIKSD